MARKKKKNKKPAKALTPKKLLELNALAIAEKAGKSDLLKDGKKLKKKLSEHTSFKNVSRKKTKVRRPVHVKKFTLLYEAELHKLQIELLKLQKQIKADGLRVCALFEGRDAAGKGEDQIHQTRSHITGDGQQQDQSGKRQNDIHQADDDRFHATAEVSRHTAQQTTHDKSNGRRYKADRHGYPGPVEQSSQDISSDGVGPQPKGDGTVIAHRAGKHRHGLPMDAAGVYGRQPPGCCG